MGGGTKRKKGKVIQVKTENRFSNTQRISVPERLFLPLYMFIKFLYLLATLKQDLYRRMPDPILQPSWILKTNKKVVLFDVLLFI